MCESVLRCGRSYDGAQGSLPKAPHHVCVLESAWGNSSQLGCQEGSDRQPSWGSRDAAATGSGGQDKGVGELQTQGSSFSSQTLLRCWCSSRRALQAFPCRVISSASRLVLPESEERALSSSLCFTVSSISKSATPSPHFRLLLLMFLCPRASIAS